MAVAARQLPSGWAGTTNVRPTPACKQGLRHIWCGFEAATSVSQTFPADKQDVHSFAGKRKPFSCVCRCLSNVEGSLVSTPSQHVLIHHRRCSSGSDQYINMPLSATTACVEDELAVPGRKRYSGPPVQLSQAQRVRVSDRWDHHTAQRPGTASRQPLPPFHGATGVS